MTIKSTTGVAIMIGKHGLATRCKNQSVIALSSGEAELYAAVFACSMGIRTRQMYEDLGVEMKVKVYMDAMVGIAMMRRQGLWDSQACGYTVSVDSRTGAKQGGGASQGLDNRELCGLDDEVIGRSTDELPFRSDGLCGAHDLIWL